MMDGMSKAEHTKDHQEFLHPIAPSAHSVFVVFQGPWLFDQMSSTEIRATTFDAMAMMGGLHECTVGAGTPGTKDLGGLVAGSKAPSIMPVASLWKVGVNGFTPKSTFEAVFAAAFAMDPFVWVKDATRRAVKPGTQDRCVVLPVPSKIGMGGRLLTAGMSSLPLLAKPANPLMVPQPYVSTVFEYQLSAPAQALTLDSQGVVAGTELTTGHLIFRMSHQMAGVETAGDDMMHVSMAFDTLMARVVDHAGVAAPIAVSLKIDTSCDLGLNTCGFDQEELGLFRSPIYPAASPTNTPKVTNFANCAGGGGPVGP